MNEIIAVPVGVLFLISFLGFVGMYFFFSRLQKLRAAEHFVKIQQYQRVSDQFLNDALSDAGKAGKRNEFMRLLMEVRRQHGHTNVTYGHIFWIDKQLEKGPLGELSEIFIPSFKSDET